MHFSTNLVYLRKKKKLSQSMVAEILSLGTNTIGSYERGDREPTLDNLINLAKLYEVSIDDLLTKDFRPTDSVFGENLKFLRNNIHAKGEEIAKIFKVSKSTYSKYENCLVEPNMEGLVAVSEFFGVSVDDLLKKDLSKEVS